VPTRRQLFSTSRQRCKIANSQVATQIGIFINLL